MTHRPACNWGGVTAVVFSVCASSFGCDAELRTQTLPAQDSGTEGLARRGTALPASDAALASKEPQDGSARDAGPDATLDKQTVAPSDAAVMSAEARLAPSAAGSGGGSASRAPHPDTADSDDAGVQSGGKRPPENSPPERDPTSFASGLSELFIDMPCSAETVTPIAQGVACSHAPNTQHVEKAITFGGERGRLYTVRLRVRAIWEPTDIAGGDMPVPEAPFTVGGMVAQNPDGNPTNAINYQQFQIQVAEPAQTYWLNNYQHTAHEIYKADYEASLRIAGGSQLKVIVHDGNDLEIGNYAQLLFSDVPPHDKVASWGQSLRLDVLSVQVAP